MLRRCVFGPPTRYVRPCQTLIRSYKLQRRWTSSVQQSTTSTTAAVSSGQTSKTGRGRWKLYAVVGLTCFTLGSWYRIIFLRQTPSKFTAHELISSTPVSSTASILTLSSSKDETPKAIYNYDFLQPQLQIVRAYTPLPNNGEDGMSFLVRHDPRGEMSSYLQRLPGGAKIELRGPNIEYDLSQSKNVVFVAGGTGIAPAMQVAHAMFDCPEEEKVGKSLVILWANRRREDSLAPIDTTENVQEVKKQAQSWWSWITGHTPQPVQSSPTIEQHVEENELRQRLTALQDMSGGRMSIATFVDEDKTWIHTGTLQKALQDVRQQTLNTAAGTEGGKSQFDVEVIVSGPPGFITYVAGPKEWKDGVEHQGVVGGRLAQALKGNAQGVKVWKV